MEIYFSRIKINIIVSVLLVFQNMVTITLLAIFQVVNWMWILADHGQNDIYPATQ